ncbi:hypothetical protein EVAR_41810_1 [Eumeta japonica]|uniref:Uncharacterized protein n=1 Tax=Eumeta variegata TaxID=151549 RepID=A0A4C1ZVM0_EUMVA|nr:hypothetical protein EVAR_41810_1 [Eumeta japonica]
MPIRIILGFEPSFYSRSSNSDLSYFDSSCDCDSNFGPTIDYDLGLVLDFGPFSVSALDSAPRLVCKFDSVTGHDSITDEVREKISYPNKIYAMLLGDGIAFD